MRSIVHPDDLTDDHYEQAGVLTDDGEFVSMWRIESEGWIPEPFTEVEPVFVRRWCSTGCGTRWWENHGWSTARPARLRHDGYRCQRCGTGDRITEAEAWHRLVLIVCPRPRIPGTWEWCDAHGLEHSDENVALWNAARVEAMIPHNRAQAVLSQMRRSASLGKHGQNGCWHHQANLVTVCRPCHAVITAEQRAAGLLG